MQQNNNEEIFKLWGELCDLGLHEIDMAMHHCMKRLSSLVGARNAFWIGAVRMAQDVDVNSDPMLGWRIRSVQYMDQAYYDPYRVRVSTQIKMVDDPGATNIAMAAGTGHFRAYRLHAGTLVD